MIAQKIQSQVYKSLNDLEADLLLMVKNAKSFNEPGSLIYKDATTLRKIITSKKTQLDSERMRPAKVSQRAVNKRSTRDPQRLSAVSAALSFDPDAMEEEDEDEDE